jgi:polygalacturonase
MNYSPLIYAYAAGDVAITGKGTLDGGGSGSTWWPWSGKKEHGWKEGTPLQKAGRVRLFAMGEARVPVDSRSMGQGQFLRPNFIQMYRCSNMLISGVRIVNSPMWVIHPVVCTGVTVENVSVFSHGPNNDGCDPESSRDVVIRGCTFDTGDDCIAIKSGRNNDGRRLHTPSENIVIQDCMFKDGHGAVTIGSEISGGAHGIYARRCSVASPVLYNALRIKTNTVRGGTIEHIYVRDMSVRLVGRAAIDVDLFYEEGKSGTHLPVVQFISVESMSVAACDVAFNLVGCEESPLRHILLRGCTFAGVQHGYAVRHVDGLQAAGTFINGTEFIPAEQ